MTRTRSLRWLALFTLATTGCITDGVGEIEEGEHDEVGGKADAICGERPWSASMEGARGSSAW